jgi:hypothetical protein
MAQEETTSIKETEEEEMKDTHHSQPKDRGRQDLLRHRIESGHVSGHHTTQDRNHRRRGQRRQGGRYVVTISQTTAASQRKRARRHQCSRSSRPLRRMSGG